MRHRAALLGFCICVAAAIAAPGTAGAQPVSTEIGPGWHPRMKADNAGRLHLLFHDGTILYYRMFSGGAWSPREKVPGSDGASGSKNLRHRMHVRPDGSKVYVTWGTGAGADVQLAFRDAAGWHGPEIACPKSVKAWEYAGVTAMSYGDAFVFCMFDDVWVARREPGGVWDAPVQIVPLQTLKHIVAETDGGDIIHAVLRGEKVHYLHGDGNVWSPLFSLAPPPTTEAPVIALDSLWKPYVAWQQWQKTGGVYSPAGVRYATGRNDQWTNGNDGVLVHAHADPANPPEITMDGADRIVVTWVEGTAAGSWVFLSSSPDGSETFLPAVKIASDAAVPKDGNLAHDLATPPAAFVGDDLHVVYEKAVKKLVHISGIRPFPPVDGGLGDQGTIEDGGPAVEDGGAGEDGGTADDGGPAAEDGAAIDDVGAADAGEADDIGVKPDAGTGTRDGGTADDAGGGGAAGGAPGGGGEANGCSCASVAVP